MDLQLASYKVHDLIHNPGYTTPQGLVIFVGESQAISQNISRIKINIIKKQRWINNVDPQS